MRFPQIRESGVFSSAAAFLLGCLVVATCISSCDSGTAPPMEISIRITQPADSQVVSGSVLRILTETSSQCGCNSHVEFYIDDVHTYSDYQPFYYFDWDIRGLGGEYRIIARLVAKGYGDDSDTVRVFIE
jgi:hypothetical protein